MPTRNNVFETNSSSTHSITIADDLGDTLDIIPMDSDGSITLKGEAFGWSWQRYNDARTKATYCMVHAAETKDRTKLGMLRQVLKDYTKASEINLEAFGKSAYQEDQLTAQGNIDHQSTGVASEAFDSKETLARFIFDPRSWLMLGNDNDYPPDSFFYYPERDKLDGILTIEGSEYPIEDIDSTFGIKHSIRSHFRKDNNFYLFCKLDIDFDNNKVDVNYECTVDEFSEQELEQMSKENVKFSISTS